MRLIINIPFFLAEWYMGEKFWEIKSRFYFIHVTIYCTFSPYIVWFFGNFIPQILGLVPPSRIKKHTNLPRLPDLVSFFSFFFLISSNPSKALDEYKNKNVCLNLFLSNFFIGSLNWIPYTHFISWRKLPWLISKSNEAFFLLLLYICKTEKGVLGIFPGRFISPACGVYLSR